MNRVTAHLSRNGGKTALRFAPFLTRRETQVLPPAIFSRVSVRSYYIMTKYQVVPLTIALNINFNQPGDRYTVAMTIEEGTRWSLNMTSISWHGITH